MREGDGGKGVGYERKKEGGRESERDIDLLICCEYLMRRKRKLTTL
jgi:hypothetical protein